MRKFTFKVVDGHTLTTLTNAEVTVIRGKNSRRCFPDMIGNPTCDLDTGKYRVQVHADGYKDLDTVFVIKADRDFCVLMMYKQTFEDRDVSFSVKESPGVISLNIEDLQRGNQDPEEEAEEETVAVDLKDTMSASIEAAPDVVKKDTIKPKVEGLKPREFKQIPMPPAPARPKPELVNSVMQPKREESIFFEEDTTYADSMSAPILPEDILNETEYLPNNIILLVDRSSSMAFEGRYTLLRRSVMKLVAHLRPVDKLSLIAYGSAAEILVQGVEGNDRKAIESGLRKLKPTGGSEYSKGLKLAYQVAQEEMITEGNNIIILATDGELVITSNTRSMISEGVVTGVKLSIFGIKNSESTERNMRQLVELGGGDYLNMRKASKVDQLLVDEIKNQSIIKK